MGDWLNDSEEQMQAEDAVWEAAYARRQDKFLTLREAARAQIEAGATEEMYDANGYWIGKHDEYDRIAG